MNDKEKRKWDKLLNVEDPIARQVWREKLEKQGYKFPPFPEDVVEEPTEEEAKKAEIEAIKGKLAELDA